MSKPEKIEAHAGGKRYDRRDDRGQLKCEVDEGRSRPTCRRHKANVIPVGADICERGRWAGDASVDPEPRAASQRLLDRGWTNNLRRIHLDRPYWAPSDAGIDRRVRGPERAGDQGPSWFDLDL